MSDETREQQLYGVYQRLVEVLHDTEQLNLTNGEILIVLGSLSSYVLTTTEASDGRIDKFFKSVKDTVHMNRGVDENATVN